MTKEIDFLPEAYRKKCQQKHWVMRRIQMSVLVACVMIAFIGYDQHSIRDRRLQVLPRLQHQLLTLENTRLQQQNVQKQLGQITFERERLYLTLLRASRSRVLGEALTQLPEGTRLQSIQLVTQPSTWIASPISSPQQQAQAQYELERMAELLAASELRLSINGSASTMDSINLYKSRLQETGLFLSMTLKETRQNGSRFDFSFVAIVVNPCQEGLGSQNSAQELAQDSHSGSVAALPTAAPLNQVPIVQP